MRCIPFLVLSFFLSFVVSQEVGIAVMRSTSNAPSSVTGTVTFTNNNNDDHDLIVQVSISGLPDGDYAIHVHEYGDLSDSSGISAGDHYIGKGFNAHGCPPADIRHQGDMGTWSSRNGVMERQQVLTLLQVSGVYSMIGRAVVLHQFPDSCNGTSGNSGVRYAIGVIGIANRSINNPAAQALNFDLLVCHLSPTVNCPECSGTVWFERRRQDVRVIARIEGLESGSRHGIHIHQFGDLRNSDGSSLGGHYNPDEKVHSLPPSTNRHEGDLGNIQNYEGSIAWYEYNNTRFRSMASITGRGMVLHETVDHGQGLGCDSVGSAGSRYATCVIGIANPSTVIPQIPININNDWFDIPCQTIFTPDLPAEEPSSDASSINTNHHNVAFLLICVLLVIKLLY